MTTTASRPTRAGSVVLLLGAGTMASAVAAVAFLMTYQGIGLIGYRTAGAAAVGILLLLGTIIAFVIANRQGPLERRTVLGLTLAVGSLPSVHVLVFATYAILGALHVYW